MNAARYIVLPSTSLLIRAQHTVFRTPNRVVQQKASWMLPCGGATAGYNDACMQRQRTTPGLPQLFRGWSRDAIGV